MNDKDKKTAVDTAVGAVNELARRGGQNMGPGNPHVYGASKVGEQIVKAAAVIAPGAVAAAATGTAAVMTVALPVAVAAAAVYAGYRFVKWLNE